ncbi:MAG: hypothetical protein NPIRA02_00820 [Nitrospirales bacterium]|nr:MAG: hypothetical protein NPIRA02_00820 [Nitrospirales bacterium]
MEKGVHDIPAWRAMAKELHEVLTLLPNFHMHQDHDVFPESLYQALKDYQFSEDEYPFYLKIRVQNFIRMELHRFTLVFQQRRRRFVTDDPDMTV